MKRRQTLAQMGSLVGLGALGAAAGSRARAQGTTESWDQVVAAAQK